MVLLFLCVCISLGAQAMQSNSSWPHHQEVMLRTLHLKKHAQTIYTIRSCLWEIKGVIVLYENYRNHPDLAPQDLHNLDIYNLNIRDSFRHLLAQCDQACKALSNSDLDNLIMHAQEAQRLYRQLQIETHTFKNIVAKRLPTSRL